ERQKHPGLVAEFIRDPVATKRRLNDAQAALYLWQASERLNLGPAERYQAALDVYRAVLLAPDNREAELLLKKLSAENKLNFDAPRNPKILELEAMAEQAPDSAGVLMQLASLYRLEGNLYKAVACFKRVLKLRPNDGYVQSQLSILTGQKTNTVAMPTAQTGVRGGATGARPALAPTGLVQPTGSSGLHTGRTGELIGPNRGGPSAPLEPAPGADIPGFKVHDDDAPSTAVLLWNAWGRKALVVGAVVLVGWLGVRKIGRSIDSAVEETDRNTQLMLKNREASERAEAAKEQEKLVAALDTKYGQEAEQALQRAASLAREGRHTDAAAAFAEVMQEFPKRPQAVAAKLGRAKSLLAAEDPVGAIAQLEAVVREHRGEPVAIEALVVLAEAHLAVNQNAEAAGTATQLLVEHEASPFAARARLARAHANQRLGNADDARKDAEWITGRYTRADPLYVQADALLATLAGPGPETPPAP
ncbi:MAG: tetratricopeptide repeat protein, partial [Myxococcales bacterium]